MRRLITTLFHLVVLVLSAVTAAAAAWVALVAALPEDDRPYGVERRHAMPAVVAGIVALILLGREAGKLRGPRDA